MKKTHVSIVEYGFNDLKSVAKGIEEKFVDGGDERRKLWQHRVVLKNLKPGQQYSKNVDKASLD